METTEIDVADQISKAKSLGILDHSPDDEVEGEMVFLQARLLDNAMVLKHRYGKFFLGLCRLCILYSSAVVFRIIKPCQFLCCSFHVNGLRVNTVNETVPI
jgi:hypothetical protein